MKALSLRYLSKIKKKGYLLASCYIIGANDKAPVHDMNEAN
jgi:hypothetical protein